MSKSRWHPAYCYVCGARASATLHISATGLCPACGDSIQVENVTGLRAKHGPAWRRWRRGMVAYVEGLVLDDVRDEA